MFELLLNAAKFVLSKDAQEGTNALFDTLRRSPEWSKDICTLIARVPATDEERFFLLIDVVVEKLKHLVYDGHCRRSFRTCSHELFSNAIEHPGQNNGRIDVTVEISPTYVSIAVRNPKHAPVNLKAWLESTSEALKESTIQDRGRGLQLIKAHADALQQIDTHVIKAVLYRDRVRIVHVTIDEDHVFGVLAGMSNPSLGPRLLREIRKSSLDEFIICLNPAEYKRLIFAEEDTFSVRTVDGELPEISDEPASSSTAITYFISHGLGDSNTTFRLVLSDEKMIDLLPEGFAFTTIDSALHSLRNKLG